METESTGIFLEQGCWGFFWCKSLFFHIVSTILLCIFNNNEQDSACMKKEITESNVSSVFILLYTEKEQMWKSIDWSIFLLDFLFSKNLMYSQRWSVNVYGLNLEFPLNVIFFLLWIPDSLRRKNYQHKMIIKKNAYIQLLDINLIKCWIYSNFFILQV